jgi:hypothetical protein
MATKKMLRCLSLIDPDQEVKQQPETFDLDAAGGCRRHQRDDTRGQDGLRQQVRSPADGGQVSRAMAADPTASLVAMAWVCSMPMVCMT